MLAEGNVSVYNMYKRNMIYYIELMEEEMLKRNWRKRVVLAGLWIMTVLIICSCSKSNQDKKDNEKNMIEAVYNSNYDAIEGNSILFELYEDKEEVFVVGCSDVEMEKIVLPDVISYDEKEYMVAGIAEGAFESNQAVTSVKMGKNVSKIEGSAFYACPELKKIDLSDTVRIGEEAFAECISLQEIEWGDSLESIGNNAFRSCEALEAVSLPASVSEWGTGIFTDCFSLRECTFEKGITNVGEGIFSNCDGLEKVVMPDTISVIGAEAFWGCMALSELTLSDTITTIGDKAFYSTGIVTLRLPEKLSGVKLELLDGMYALETIQVPESKLENYEEVFENYGIEIATY